MNARFWIWYNDSWVKLTMRPGQVIEFVAGGSTDEGCWSECRSFVMSGPEVRPEYATVTEECCRYERDCDGPHEESSQYECILHLLQNRDIAVAGAPPLPAWQLVDSGQRDHYAEAMGY